MLYHLVHAPRIVANEDDEKILTDEGWTELPVQATPEAMLRAQIDQKEKELAVLYENLTAILKVKPGENMNRLAAVPEPDKAAFTCLVCREPFESRGKFLVHMKQHKKDSK
jgi:hypothetical protein